MSDEWEFDTLDEGMMYVPFDASCVKVTTKGLFYEIGTPELMQSLLAKRSAEYEDSPREEP